MAEKNKTIFNEVSDKLKSLIKKTVTEFKFLVPFQLTIGKMMQIPVREGHFVTRMVYPASVGFPERDIIIDGEDMKDIGAIERFDDLGVPVFSTLRVDAEQEGYFQLDYRNPKDKIWIDYLICSNFCTANPDRIQGKEMCKIVDVMAESKAKMAKMSTMQAAFTLAMDMEDSDIVDFAAAMDWDEKLDPAILKPMVVELATTQPEFFKEFIDGNGVELRSLLKKAVTTGVVIYNSSTQELSWKNGEVFATLKSEQGKTYLSQFIGWVTAHPKGVETVDIIRNQMAKGKPAKQPAAKKPAVAKPDTPALPENTETVPPNGDLDL